MYNQTNYHSHSSFCDGKNTAAAFVKAAIEKGFYSYGISSHAPVPFETNWCMQAADLPVYMQELQALKEQYADQIALAIGLEIDYLHAEHNPAMSLFANLPLDYRIGSVHMLGDMQGELRDLDVAPETFKAMVKAHFGNDLVEVIKAYFRQKQKMIVTGGLDIVGHIDKISMNALFCEADITKQSWYKRVVEDTLETALTRDVMVEINTKAFAHRGLFFPNEQHFLAIREMGLPVLVNSDSHTIDKMTSGRSEALERLHEVGIRTVMEWLDGRWQAQEIGIIKSKEN